MEAVVKGVTSRKLADLIATYQIPVPFSFIHFQDIVVQFAQRVPQLHSEISEISVVTGPCFRRREPGHVANDCVLPRETPTCYIDEM